MNREQQLTEAFVSLADTLSEDVDPPTLLRRLVDHSVRLTPMDAAGVMLANARGRLRPVVATDDRAAVTELFQTQIDEGPCIEAYETGTPVHVEDFAAYEERWPSFVPVVRAAGYASAHALPLQVRGQRIGALNLLSHTATSLSPSETGILRGLANVAAAAVVTWNRDLVRPTDIASRSYAALSAKALLDTAAGMIAATEDITPLEAARRLRAYAALHHRRPTDVAEELVRRRMEVAAVMNAAV
ncbi:GAF domain-containing protein [Streptomyces sp. NK15101]|uniref:GAF domain-containing protein n=1 Tax=Streptomyces sp. NK15101 TaxID=2873261 RepID=UPI001CECF86C|nr:GAF domain-containing protein [Streptomyces sp. NK15101]